MFKARVMDEDDAAALAPRITDAILSGQFPHHFYASLTPAELEMLVWAHLQDRPQLLGVPVDA